jgi:hypothetical protein
LELVEGHRAGRKKEKKICKREREREGSAVSALPLVRSSGDRW